jgi:uncharacterized repeat protein (TIGR01451 family)
MTNHNPNITSSSANVSFSEDANTTGSTVDHVLTGTMNFTDSDHSDAHTTTTALKTAVWSGGSTLPVGALTKFQAGLTSSIVSDSNGSGKLKWTFSEDDRDFDFLAKNETLVLTYEITLSDNHGGSTKQTVKMTVTGTDDRPVFATTTGATLSEQANHSLSLSPDIAHIALQFSDADLNNTGHTACVLSVSAMGNTSGILPGSFGTAELMSFYDINNVVKSAGSSNGTVNTTFSAPDLAFDYLAAGEQINITYVVQIDDQKGGVSTQNVTVTVNGTNDKPVVLAFPESAHLTEDHNLSGGNLTANGDFWFSDLDLSDTHTVSTTATATRSGGGTVPISNSDLIDAMGAIIDPDSTSHVLGEVDWNFALPNSAVDFLAEGETLTLKYQIIVTDSAGASDTEEVCITVLGINKPVVTKTATVPGGTADHAGEVISYDIAVANAGHSDLTGITVTDPSVSNLAPVLSSGFNSGDTNHDNKLTAGETWHYTASHTVTQNDINTNGGGDGHIDNTVTVDTAETLPVSATASVVVESGASVEMTKTADVSSVDAVGDVINYTVNVQNNGNATLTELIVTDPQVTFVTPILDTGAPILGTQPFLVPILVGDYNIGDVGTPGHPEFAQNSVQDLGETFQFANAGDNDQNGIEDPGETFLFANVGDTNQNGVPDFGETFQYYNAGDTNHDGVENNGETFQFNVSHQLPGVDANHDGFNDGDTDFDGTLTVGETWHYTADYTVTQADIDNGGVVNPGLAHNNTASAVTAEGVTGSANASVAIVQNPHLIVTKNASIPDADHDGKIDSPADDITYTITLVNDGNMTLTGVSVNDSVMGGLTTHTETGGTGTNGDNIFNVGETWTYTAVYNTQQSDIDNRGNVDGTADDNIHNTASVTTAQSAGGSAFADVLIDYSPHLAVTKTAAIPDADHDGKIDSPTDDITFTITLMNDGNVTLTGVNVNDSIVGGLTAHIETGGTGTNGDNILNVGETWTYTAVYNTQQSDIDNRGNVDGTADDNIHNTASVSTTQGASGSASADVPIDYRPTLTIGKSADVASVAAAGDVINYTVTVENTGNVSLTSVSLADSLTGSLTTHAETAGAGVNGDDILDVGETWTYATSYTAQASDFDGSIDNTATVDTAQTNPQSASASVTAAAPSTVGISIDDNFNTSHLVDPGGDGPSVGDLIQFFFQITNLGNTTLTSVAVSDILGDVAAPGSLQTPIPSSLAGNATFVDTFNHHITAGDLAAHHVIDDITVTALDYLSATQTATWHYDFLV